MKKINTLILFAIFTFCANAQAPQSISWQGILQDSDGNLLDGTYKINVELFDVESGGIPIWDETHLNVEVTNGLVNLILGSQIPLDISFNSQYWLQIYIGIEPLSRIKLTSVPYALYAESTGDNNSWKLEGNNDTSPENDFIGTTDENDLSIRTNNILRAKITQKGQIEVFNTGNSVFLGEEAGKNDDLENNKNVYIGYQSGMNSVTASYNVSVGYLTLQNNQGSNNSAFGASAMESNTSGSWNSSFGAYSLENNTIGYWNSAFGTNSLHSNINGELNSAFGSNSLKLNTYGQRNSAFGFGALEENEIGDNNSAFGVQSLYSNVDGEENSAFGAYALYSNIGGGIIQLSDIYHYILT